MLVSLDVDDENESVVVFDFLHRGFSGQRVLDDVVSIHSENTEKSMITSLRLAV